MKRSRAKPQRSVDSKIKNGKSGDIMPIKSLIRGKKSAVADKKSEPEKNREGTEASVEARIDFPKEGDKILAGHYAVRISAKSGADVEISAGGDEWWPCRESVGFYWFDWWPSKPGRANLSVRVKVGKGRWKKVTERSCSVIAGGTN